MTAPDRHIDNMSGVSATPAPGVVSSDVLDGPWTNAFWFGVTVPFQSKSNDRRNRNRAEAAALIRRRKSFNLLLRLAAQAARPAGWVVGERGVPVAQRPAVVGLCYAHSLIDAGNLSKSVYDALEGIVYVTDASVRLDMSMTTRATGPGTYTGLVAFAQVDPTATAAEIAAAGSGLLVAALGASSHLFTASG